MQPPVLHTPRLVLRPFEESDAPAMFAYASNPNVSRMTLWDAHRSVADSLAFIRASRDGYARNPLNPFAAIERSTGMLLGTVGMWWTSPQHGVMEMGYAIGEEHWGKGFTAEAMRAIVEYGFANIPHLYCIDARCIRENVGSYRVMEKLGMRRDGLLRGRMLRKGRRVDLFVYSLLRGEWEDSRTRLTTEV